MNTTSRPNVEKMSDDDVAAADDAPAQAFREASAQFGELKAYAAQYVAAKLDLAKLSLRRIAILAILGIIGLLAGAAMVVMAVVQLLSGVAQAIGAALGGRMWAGDLIVGGAIVGIIAIGAWIGLNRLSISSRNATVKRYEQRQRRQRAEHGGHDASQRSAENAFKTGH